MCVGRENQVINSFQQSRSNKYCFDPADTVKITLGVSGIQSEEPITIPKFLRDSCNANPNVVALQWKYSRDANAPWHSMTYAEYHKCICEVAKSFLKVSIPSAFNT